MYTGQEFVKDVLEALQNEGHEEWYMLPVMGAILPAHCGAAGTVIGEIDPRDAWELRNGYRGAPMFFALLRDGRFVILLETEPTHKTSAIHYSGFDFIGGEKAVYESDL